MRYRGYLIQPAGGGGQSDEFAVDAACVVMQSRGCIPFKQKPAWHCGYQAGKGESVRAQPSAGVQYRIKRITIGIT